IIPRYLTVSEDTPPLYINDSNPVPPPALICTDKNRSAPHLLASSVLLFKDTVLSVFLLIFTVTSLYSFSKLFIFLSIFKVSFFSTKPFALAPPSLPPCPASKYIFTIIFLCSFFIFFFIKIFHDKIKIYSNLFKVFYDANSFIEYQKSYTCFSN